MNNAMYPIVENFVLVIMFQEQRINVKCIHKVIVILKPHKPRTTLIIISGKQQLSPVITVKFHKRTVIL